MYRSYSVYIIKYYTLTSDFRRAETNYQRPMFKSSYLFRLLSMRMPNSNRTSSFSVRDILDLGPKPTSTDGDRASPETKLPAVKTEQKPDVLKTGVGLTSSSGSHMSVNSPVISSSTPAHSYLAGARPPFHFGQWSNLSPFLTQTKCKLFLICSEVFECPFVYTFLVKWGIFD